MRSPNMPQILYTRVAKNLELIYTWAFLSFWTYWKITQESWTSHSHRMRRDSSMTQAFDAKSKHPTNICTMKCCYKLLYLGYSSCWTYRKHIPTGLTPLRNRRGSFTLLRWCGSRARFPNCNGCDVCIIRVRPWMCLALPKINLSFANLGTSAVVLQWVRAVWTFFRTIEWWGPWKNYL